MTDSKPGPVHIDRPSGTHDPVLTTALNVFLAVAEEAGFAVEGWHIRTLPEAASSPRCLVDHSGNPTPFATNLGWTDLEAARCLTHYYDALRAKCALDRRDDPRTRALLDL